MAPAKTMGADRNPNTKPGVTGFVQEYNQEPGARQDLNPDVVTDNSVLPEPVQPREAASPRRAAKGTRKARGRKAAK